MWAKLWERIKSISPDTWARSVCFFLALINQTLAVLGRNKIPFVEDDVYQLVSLFATFVTGIIAWWKDNPVTKEAQKSNAYMKKLKAESTLAQLEPAIEEQLDEIEAFEDGLDSGLDEEELAEIAEALATSSSVLEDEGEHIGSDAEADPEDNCPA